MQVSFNIIYRDNKDSILDLLNSTLPCGVEEYVFCDTGCVDGTTKMIEDWGVANGKTTSIYKYADKYGYSWTDDKQELYDFGKARQIAIDNTKTEYACWIDTDDILEFPERFQEVFKFIVANDYDWAFFPYRYGVDGNNHDELAHYRERIVRVEGLRWCEPVHEFPRSKKRDLKTIQIDDIKWRHKRKPEHVERTSRRNLKILMHQLETIKKAGKQPHLRVLQSIAYDHFERREYPDAIKYYKEYFNSYRSKLTNQEDIDLHKPQEVFNLFNYSRCLIETGELDKALTLLQEIYSKEPSSKELHLMVCELYLRKGDINLAEFFLRVGGLVEYKQTMTPVNKVEQATRESLLWIEVYQQRNDFMRAMEKVQQLAPYMVDKQRYAQIQAGVMGNLENKTAFDGYFSLRNKLYSEGSIDKLGLLIDSVPKTILSQVGIQRDIERINIIRQSYEKRRAKQVPKTGQNIAIYTGNAWEAWAGDCELKGMGGSESMVARVSRELVKQGAKVTVYNDCRELAGVYDGVDYKPYTEYKNEMEYDVLIVSRIPQLMVAQTQMGFEPVMHASTRQVLWLHDTHYGDIPAIAFNNFDKVFVLSEFHKGSICGVHKADPDKMWVTRNSIDTDHYNELIEKHKPVRDPHQIIYCSSYDRGLYEFLLSYKKIKAQVPDVKAKVYYGWNTYEKRMNAMPENFSDHPSRMSMREYKKRVEELMDELGVVDGGRIGQDELLLENARSGIWMYPTWFSEISCITAMVAQFTGAIPCVTPVAALNETVKVGFKLQGNELTEKVIELLKDDKKAEEVRKDCINIGKTFDTKSLVSDWINKFAEI